MQNVILSKVEPQYQKVNIEPGKKFDCRVKYVSG